MQKSRPSLQEHGNFLVMNTEKRIVVACFMGAALGALIALQLNRYFWWLGILAGGAIGYICFRFKEAIQSICRVWKSLPDAEAVTAAVKTGLWNSARLTGVVIGIACCAASMLIMMVGGVMALLVGSESSVKWEGPTEVAKNVGITGTYLGVGAIVICLAGIFLFICVLKSSNKEAACWGIVGCLLMNPLILPITVFSVLAWAIVPCAGKAALKLSVLSFEILRRTFIMIHSEMRLLCMANALIGALAGFFWGKALLGGIVGAVCGLVNYKFISVRWLKLAKA
jgi:hypothetical protein